MSWFSKLFGLWTTIPAIKPTVVKSSDGIDSLSDLDIVARTIWGEARNQGLVGMVGVASVIQTRAHIGGWWGNTPRDVCLKPWQFSCWNSNNPNRPKMLSVDSSDPQYQDCLSVAKSVMTGTLNDTVNGADSYEVRGTGASWIAGLTPVASIGAHDFYITRKTS